MPISKCLVAALTDAARRAFTAVRNAHPDEHFYVFGLFSETGDDLQPTCNSEEGLARALKRLRKKSAAAANELRYFAEEFEYHQGGEEHFAGLGKITDTPGADDCMAAEEALGTLVREGFFGRGKARDDVAVLILKSDQSNGDLIKRAQNLNPKSVMERLQRLFPVRQPSRHWSKTIGTERAYSIDDLALSADGRVLAAAGGFGGDGIFVWRLDDRPTLLFRDKVRGDSVWSVAISRDGACLYGKGKTSVRRWDVLAKKPLPPFGTRGDELASLALSPDGAVLACASYRSLRKEPFVTDQVLALLDAQDGTERVVKPIDASFLAFAPDGKLLAHTGKIGGSPGIGLLEVPSLKPVFDLHCGDTWIRQCAFSPAGDVLAGALDGEGSGICIFDLRRRRLRRRITDYRGRVNCVAFSPDGRHLAAALESGRVRCWDAATGALRLNAHGRHENLSAVTFLDANHVAGGGTDVDKGPPVTVWELPVSSSRR